MREKAKEPKPWNKLGHFRCRLGKSRLTSWGRMSLREWAVYRARRAVTATLSLACALTGHAGGCWLLNECPGISALWYWADDMPVLTSGTQNSARVTFTEWTP